MFLVDFGMSCTRSYGLIHERIVFIIFTANVVHFNSTETHLKTKVHDSIHLVKTPPTFGVLLDACAYMSF